MAVGIIAEYNPFHAGHAYQISEVRKIFPGAEIVAVMSGSFTQRGEPAILDKMTRARLAIEGGCDLVLELPFVSVVRSAQDFARGGVRLLHRLGVVDSLAFGAEFPDVEKIKSAAKILDEKIFSAKIKSEMSGGISYAAAVTKILSRSLNVEEKFLRQPNTILAIEYLRALPEVMQPILIQRVGAGHLNLNLSEKFSGAAAIREEVYKPLPDWKKISASVGEKVLDELMREKNSGPVREEFLFRPILAKLFTTTPDDLRKIYGMREGLEFRLIKSAKSAKTFDEFISGIVGRRYHEGRVKRLLLRFLLDLTEEKISEINSADYVRVLAFNERGKNLLKKIRDNSDLPIVTKVTQHLTGRDFERKNFSDAYKKNLALDCVASNLRGILFDVPKKPGQDFLNSPCFIKGVAGR